MLVQIKGAGVGPDASRVRLSQALKPCAVYNRPWQFAWASQSLASAQGLPFKRSDRLNAAHDEVSSALKPGSLPDDDGR